MLFDLPFSSYDHLRELGYEARLDCLSRHHKLWMDLTDPRLSGKSFGGGQRFVCSNFIKRWTASPGFVCNSLAHVEIYLPHERKVSMGDHGVVYCSLGCGTCDPSWSIDQMRRDDPKRAPLNDKRFAGYRCTTCRRGMWSGWHGFDTRPHLI